MLHLINNPWSNDWQSTAYLAGGNSRQRTARICLQRLGIHRKLAPFHPVLAGTIPIGCDVPGSDLDILCQAENPGMFIRTCSSFWAGARGFTCKEKSLRGSGAAIVRFHAMGFAIEMVAMTLPVVKQYAYAHMLAEAWMLHKRGIANTAAIRRLKESGLSTELAFAQHFALSGDPYETLYKLYLHERQRQAHI